MGGAGHDRAREAALTDDMRRFVSPADGGEVAGLVPAGASMMTGAAAIPDG
jgi:hypothetical protein